MLHNCFKNCTMSKQNSKFQTKQQDSALIREKTAAGTPESATEHATVTHSQIPGGMQTLAHPCHN